MKKLFQFNNDTSAGSESGTTIMNFSSFLNKLFIILLIVFTSSGLHAQVVMELNSYLEQLKASVDPVLVTNLNHLESLIKDVQPTVYVCNTITTNGETQPVCANVKAGSINQIIVENPLFNQVELIMIRLKNPSDLNFVLDLAKLTSFTNLKYVYFLCEFQSGIEVVQKLFIPKIGITVFYKVSIPS